MESIAIGQLVKRFGEVRALDGVSLEVGAGELFFLLGPSGCGKTTLLRCLAGLEQPDSGTIRFGGTEVTALPPHRREAAMVFQSYALWPHLDVARNVAFGLEERRVPRDEIRRRVGEALELVRLGGLGNRAVDELSGGQQQRVALARALVVRPKCLLLDEPLSNLDAKLRVEMRREIRRIVKEGGLTGVYVTHDQEEALATADRIAVLEEGRVRQVGAPEEIYRNPRSSFVAGFIGETNLLRGSVESTDGDMARVSTTLGSFDGRSGDPGRRPVEGSAVMLSIRPEAWRAGGGGANTVSGTIASRAYLGQRIQYEIATEAGRVELVEVNPERVRESGEPILVSVSADDVVIVND